MKRQDRTDRPLIIVFAKKPVPSGVKTRLIPLVGADAASELHRAFVLDTLAGLHQLRRTCDVELHTNLVDAEWPRVECGVKLQISGDLGSKLLAAMSEALGEGRERAAIIGSDSPTLPAPHIEALLALDADVCLGPAEDGGFWGIACRRTSPLMFDGVHWSAADTLQSTIDAVRRAGLSVAIGQPWYDVDDGDDLRRLASDAGLRDFTRAVLRATANRSVADGRAERWPSAE